MVDHLEKFKCPYEQKFLLEISKLGVISDVSVKIFFNLVKSSRYGGLKLPLNGPCPSFEKS